MKAETPGGSHLGDLSERYDWKRVVCPRIWRPKQIGDELLGFYGGKTVRNGQYGQYEVAIVHTPLRGSQMISGAQILQLVDASGIERGWPIRIIWMGLKDLGKDGEGRSKRMKEFELYIAEGPSLHPDQLPEIQAQESRVAE